MINKYIREYCADFRFDYREHISLNVAGVDVEIDVFEAKKTVGEVIHHREKASVMLRKGAKRYECEFFDAHNYEKSFYHIELNGCKYICFRKTLYGFTLIDADTLIEAYDYFPQSVFVGDEAFITADVKQLGEILVFDGCYWACPYECFVCDFEQKLFLNISQMKNVYSLDEAVVCGDELILIGMNKDGEKTKATVEKQEIRQLINELGVAEF